MHGSAHIPPATGAASHPAVRIALRVVFTALSFLSFGLLSWVTLLRIAIMRGGWRDWLLFWGSFPVLVGAMWTFSVGDTSEKAQGIDYVGLLALFLLAAGVAAYYLVVDIRHHQVPVPLPPPLPPHPPRIARVQAELDELSDLLRREQDGGR